MAKAGPEEQEQIYARDEKDWTRTVVSRQGPSRSRTDQTHGKEETRQSKRGQDWKDNAMEGHDRTMPKKDMAELDRDSAGQHLGALRLAIRLSCQDAVRTLLW